MFVYNPGTAETLDMHDVGETSGSLKNINSRVVAQVARVRTKNMQSIVSVGGTK